MLPVEFPFQQRSSTSEDQGVASLQRPGGIGEDLPHLVVAQKRRGGECFPECVL